MMLRKIINTDIPLSATPPFLKLSKNPGPTCRPMQKTNRIRPKSCRKLRIGVGPVKPKWPATMPQNKTNVTPRDMPPIFNLPNIMPMAITMP